MPLTSNPYPVFTYLAHEIRLTDNFFFHVTGPEFDIQDVFFESRRSAMQEIHRRIQASLSAQLNNPSSKNLVLTSDGETAFVFRINPTTGRIADLETSDFIYPNLPWIKTLLLDRRDLQTQITLIDHELSPISIPVRRTTQRIFDITWLTLKLETELREKRAFALKEGTQR